MTNYDDDTSFVSDYSGDSSSSDESSESTAQSYAWFDVRYGMRTFCKLSKSVDYVAIHEARIGTALNKLNHKNIVKYYGICETPIDISIMDSDPRIIDAKSKNRTFLEPTTLWEPLDGVSMHEIFSNPSITDDAIAGCVTQVVFTVLELQERVGFVHGDLNLGNVLICKADDDFLEYTFGGNTERVRTCGLVAKLIDFGNTNLWKENSFEDNSKIRITVPLFSYFDGKSNIFYDKYADLRFFMDNVSDELFKSRKTNFVSEYQRMAFNIFSNSGPGLICPKSCVYEELMDSLHECFETIPESSRVENDKRFMLDALLSFIILPLDLKRKITESEIKKLDNMFDKNGVVYDFIKSWSVISRYFTARQSDFVFRDIAFFVAQNMHRMKNEENEVAREFNGLVHNLLKSFGQTMISIEMIKTLRLLLTMCRIQTPLTLFVLDFVRNYLKKIKFFNNDTTKLLKVYSPSSSLTIARLLNHWRSLC
jgi:serine/threonine protein kinase